MLFNCVIPFCTVLTILVQYVEVDFPSLLCSPPTRGRFLDAGEGLLLLGIGLVNALAANLIASHTLGIV